MIAGYDIAGLIAIATTVVLWLWCRPPQISRDIKIIFMLILFCVSFHFFSNSLEWLGVTDALDSFEDFIELLEPVLWGLLFYTYLREKTEDAIRQSRRRYQRLLENVGLGISLIDSNFTIQMSNSTKGRLFHKTPAELVGKKCYEEFEKRKAICPHCPGLRSMRELAPMDVETEGVRDDGSRFNVRLHTYPVLDEKGKAVGFTEIAEDITERKLAESGLKQSQAEIQSIFRAAPTGIGMVVNRILTQVNDKILEITGYSRDELIGETMQMLYASQEEYERVGRDKYAQVEAYGTGAIETVWKRKDGRLIDILLCSTPIDPVDLSQGVTFTALDITERNQAHRELEQAKATLQAAMEQSQVGMAIGDKNGVITFVNKAGLAIGGFHKLGPDMDFDKIVKARDFKTLDGELLPIDEIPLMKAIRTGEKISKEFILCGYEKDVVLMDEASPIRDESENIVGGITVFLDITSLREAEQQRLKMEAQVQHTQKLESLGILAGGIAHDFNNLLVAILGNADLALMGMSSVSPERQSVEEIKRAAKRASDLTSQLLAYSGKGKFVVKSLKLNDLVEDMGHLLGVSISKKVVLRYDLTDKLPAISADVNQLRQVVMNLITNASDAIGDRSGIITIRTSLIDAKRDYLAGTFLDDGLPEGYYVCLEVADTGCGMDEKTKSRLFDPFFTTKFAGRGLGLAAVLGIVRGHNGTIKVYSELGKGSTFRVLLPASDKLVESLMPEEDTKQSNWQGEGTILVADDEPSVCNIAKIMLERIGFNVLTVPDGREAVNCFEKRSNEIDLVLLDMTMPRLSGEEAFREIRKRCPETKIILCSGYSEQEATNRFAGKHLNGFIQKPYEMSKLVSTIREVMEEDDA